MQLMDYKIHLNTGEDIEVLEIDSEVIPALKSIEFSQITRSLFDHCSYIPRSVVEEAKSGYSATFESMMRSQAAGNLLKFKNPICRLIKECSMANPIICSTTNVSKSGKGKFPICWEFNCPSDFPATWEREISDLAFHIVHAWRDGKYVIFIEN